MKKAFFFLFLCVCAALSGDDSAVIELHSGWSWYPYSSYYYPWPYRYYTPWGLTLRNRSTDGRFYGSPYYAGAGGYPYWYDSYAYPCYYGYPGGYSGFCFMNKPYIVELPPHSYLSLDDIPRPSPDEPGTAPLTLPDDDYSLQDERLRRFLENE